MLKEQKQNTNLGSSWMGGKRVSPVPLLDTATHTGPCGTQALSDPSADHWQNFLSPNTDSSSPALPHSIRKTPSRIRQKTCPTLSSPGKKMDEKQLWMLFVLLDVRARKWLLPQPQAELRESPAVLAEVPSRGEKCNHFP